MSALAWSSVALLATCALVIVGGIAYVEWRIKQWNELCDTDGAA